MCLWGSSHRNEHIAAEREAGSGIVLDRHHVLVALGVHRGGQAAERGLGQPEAERGHASGATQRHRVRAVFVALEVAGPERGAWAEWH